MITRSLRTDCPLVRSSASSVRHVLITVDAPVSTGPRASRPPVDVAFVLDRSGSMSGEKIVLAREAIVKGLGMLSPSDRSTIVVYDTEIDVVAPLSRDGRRQAAADLALIDARGGTDLAAGWLTACMQLAEADTPGDLRKCLLMSDGQANHGITDHAELERHAAELRARGIITSTFGVGRDFDEELMTAVARAGGGQAYFIEHANQTLDLLTSELGETLDTVLRDVVLRLTVPAGVSLEVMSDFTMTGDGSTNEVRLGHMVSGQSLSVLVRVDCPVGELGRTLTLGASVTSREEPESAWTELAWTYADDAANERQERNSEVDTEVAKVHAARARREALHFSRRGDFVSARAAISSAAAGLRPLAARSISAQAEMDLLQDEAPLFARAMPAMEMKQREYAARGTLASRDAKGRARRSGTEPHTP